LIAGRVVARNGEFGRVDAGGHELTALMPAGIKAGDPVRVAVRPENMRLGANGSGEPNRFTARIAGRRYQGTQTVYELAALGTRLEALELGTSARHPLGGEVDVVLPSALCWAYPDEGGDSA
jgi:iron(III) transport system ATP-binding protein